MNNRNNLPVVGNKIEVAGIGIVYCSRAENGTLAFLARNNDDSISRYEIRKDKIKISIFNPLTGKENRGRASGHYTKLNEIKSDSYKYIFEEIAENKNPNRCNHRGIFNPPNGKEKTQQSCGVLNPFEGNKNIYRGDGDFVRLDRKLRSAKL